jgi:integrase
VPRIKLTERVIARLKGRPADSRIAQSKEPIVYWDLAMPGFGVMVSTKTGLKTYVVQRDMPNGKSPRRKIGRVSEHFPLEQARKQADELIRQLNSGIDPKVTAKGAVTLAQAADAYLNSRPNLAETSKRDYARIFNSYLADWRDMKLGAISRDMVEARYLELGKKYPATANGVMRAIRAVFNFSIGRYPDVTANPVTLSQKQWFDVQRRDRHVSADQLAKFYNAVLKLENTVARDYILLLLFTGLRREEAAGLTWRDVDFTARVIRLPALRTKARRQLDLPMSDVVLKMLKARRDIGYDKGFVFPANSSSGHISEPKFPLKLVADATGIEISAHDLRRTFANAAIAARVHGLYLKALLNHAAEQRDVTAGYVTLTVEDLREPAQAVADVLKAWCKISPKK